MVTDLSRLLPTSPSLFLNSTNMYQFGLNDRTFFGYRSQGSEYMTGTAGD